LELKVLFLFIIKGNFPKGLLGLKGKLGTNFHLPFLGGLRKEKLVFFLLTNTKYSKAL